MQFRQQSDISLNGGWFLPIFVLSAVLYASAARSEAPAAQPVTISPADLPAWQAKSFKGETAYRVEDGGQGPALRAMADGSASGLCRTVQIDLDSLPILRWHWRLDHAPARRNERMKGGDDQGLRLSFLHQSGAGEDSILAIQYVCSQSEPVGAHWANAFVANAQQVVAHSGPAQPGLWRSEQRDLAADFRAAFGRAVDRIDAICLMSDGDQTGALVEGWYGDITFQAR
ncbi:DUF3047 domain-containing protein [Dongia deserti]|uniref:DUF3047 domain-containing protein n=1 Tax=Dongia deserti TaxID=2268030 RepID=UPI000E647B07|nr:DUF3047 domain-containing protein [Dongia deserti]